MRILQRYRKYFLIRIVKLNYVPFQQSDHDILVPRSLISDYGPTTFSDRLKEYFWNLLDIFLI